MKYCDSCRVKVEGSGTRCPLCHNRLRDLGGQEPPAFPHLPLLNPKQSFLYRLLQFLTIVVAAVSVAVNFALPESGWWSLFILAGLGCGWLCLLVFVRKRHNPLKALSWQVLLGILLCVAWDIGTGWHGWSVDFVIPSLLITAMATTLVLVLALHIPTEDSFIYICFIAVLGLLPVISLFTGLCAIIYPSLVCVVASIVYLAALFTLQGAPFRSELRRRFHL